MMHSFCSAVQWNMNTRYSVSFLLFSPMLLWTSDELVTSHQRSSKLGPTSSPLLHAHTHKGEIVETNLSLCCFSWIQSRLPRRLWRRSSGSFIRREIKSSSTATGCWECFISGRGNKSLKKNQSFEAKEIISFPFITSQQVMSRLEQ